MRCDLIVSLRILARKHFIDIREISRLSDRHLPPRCFLTIRLNTTSIKKCLLLRSLLQKSFLSAQIGCSVLRIILLTSWWLLCSISLLSVPLVRATIIPEAIDALITIHGHELVFEAVVNYEARDALGS